MSFVVSLSVNNLSKAKYISRKDLNAAFPAKLRYVAVPTKSMPTAVRWSFFLLVATIPFELADFTLMSGTLSPPKISGYLFFVVYLFYYTGFSPKRFFPHPPYAVWWFLAYVVVYALNGFFLREELLDQFFALFFTLLQLVVFFWIASDLLKDRKIVTTVLLTYSIASTILALGIVLGIPGFSVTIVADRITTTGDNPNYLGLLMSLPAVMLIGLSLDTSLRRFTRKLLLPVVMLPLLVVVVKTGSRGALTAFVIGCSVYLLPFGRSKRGLSVIILALLGVGSVVYMSVTNPVVLERWQSTYYEGNLAKRDTIFIEATEMILERPIFGWQPIELWYELGSRTGHRLKDAHNLYLHLLLEVGLVGAIPFLVGLGACGWAAWRARHGNLGLLPLALLLALLADNMSGTDLKLKSFWLVLALALASASSATRGSGQQFYVPLAGRAFKNRA